jgi:hypothetical protein
MSTTKTKENGSFVRIKAFATKTKPHLVAAKDRVTKSAVVTMNAVKDGAKMLWKRVIVPTYTFIQRWFSPLLHGLWHGYVAMCLMTITVALLSPVPGGRYAGMPMIWALLNGFRGQMAR